VSFCPAKHPGLRFANVAAIGNAIWLKGLGGRASFQALAYHNIQTTATMRIRKVSAWQLAAVPFLLAGAAHASLGDRLPDFKDCLKVCNCWYCLIEVPAQC
jgi:hypothetical protein